MFRKFSFDLYTSDFPMKGYRINCVNKDEPKGGYGECEPLD